MLFVRFILHIIQVHGELGEAVTSPGVSNEDTTKVSEEERERLMAEGEEVVVGKKRRASLVAEAAMLKVTASVDKVDE